MARINVNATSDVRGGDTDGSWLVGRGSPPAGSGLAPLDGVNDPYRWAINHTDMWVGRAVNIIVDPGTIIPWESLQFLPHDPAAAQMDLFLTSQLTISKPGGSVPGFFNQVPRPGSGQPQQSGISDFFYQGAYDPENWSTLNEIDYVSDNGGTGIAYLTQFELGWPSTPGAVPVKTIDVTDVLSALNVTGIHVGDPFEFTETTPIGVDGQFYLDKDTRDVYYRDSGLWSKLATLPAPS